MPAKELIIVKIRNVQAWRGECCSECKQLDADGSLKYPHFDLATGAQKRRMWSNRLLVIQFPLVYGESPQRMPQSKKKDRR